MSRKYIVRFPRKLKKRLISLNGRGKVLTCLMMGKLLYETTGRKQYDLYKCTNVYKDGWAVKNGHCQPFEMKK
jgi:hypothetical protein